MFKRLSFHDIFEILKFYQFNVTKQTKPYDLFGKLRRFGRENIYPVFINVYIECFKKKLFIPNNIRYFGVRNTRIKFQKLDVFPNLHSLYIHSPTTYVNFMKNFGYKINKEKFPVLNFVSFGTGEGRFGSTPEETPVQRTVLDYYPSKIENDSYILLLNDKRLGRGCLSNITYLYFLLEHTITGRSWKSLTNLKELYLIHCDNFSNDFFCYQELPKLEILDLTNCPQITGRNWYGCKNLKVLILRDNLNFETDCVKNFKNLEDVSFRIIVHQYQGPIRSIEFASKSMKTCFIFRYGLSLNNLKSINSTLKKLYIEGINNVPWKWPVMPCLTDLRLRSVNKLCIFDNYCFPNLKILFLYKTQIATNIINDKNFENIFVLIVYDYNKENNICDPLLSEYKFPSLTVLILDCLEGFGYGWINYPKEGLYVSNIRDYNPKILENENVNEINLITTFPFFKKFSIDRWNIQISEFL